MHPVVYLLDNVYDGQPTQQLLTIKHNRHRCVNNRFYLRMFSCSTPLLAHLQAYAMQAAVTEINMNSYCAQYWF
jgi:hypothetical protein